MFLDKFEGLALLSVYEVLLLEVLGVVLGVAAVLVMLGMGIGGGLLLLLLLQRLSHVAVHELVLQLLQLSLQVAAAITQEL